MVIGKQSVVTSLTTVLMVTIKIRWKEQQSCLHMDIWVHFETVMLPQQILSLHSPVAHSGRISSLLQQHQPRFWSAATCTECAQVKVGGIRHTKELPQAKTSNLFCSCCEPETHADIPPLPLQKHLPRLRSWAVCWKIVCCADVLPVTRASPAPSWGKALPALRKSPGCWRGWMQVGQPCPGTTWI